LWRAPDGRPLAAAQLLLRTLGGPLRWLRLSSAYCPRGPLLDWSDRRLAEQILEDLRRVAAQYGAYALRIDPDLALGYGLPEDGRPDPVGLQLQSSLESNGWSPAAEQVQFRNTMIIDLHPSEEELLADMKQKTRYNVRLAGRREVMVRQGGREDFDLLYDMYAETSLRDGFAIRAKAYYHDAWGLFLEAGKACPLIAEAGGEPIAAVVIFRHADRAWYLHGMSRHAQRDKMPNYLLQWEAIRWAKAQGCSVYDLWGAPDTFLELDPMWGVYRFKAGFNAQVVRTIGAWDLALRPGRYRLVTTILPRLMALMRLRGRARARRAFEAADLD
jgi:lipid II:glycine glycyltransferase (peptidoglycan interpeptide bridge formation enzyme)